MSRIANNPVSVPSGVEISLDAGLIKVKGPKGELEWSAHELVSVEQGEAELRFKPANESSS